MSIVPQMTIEPKDTRLIRIRNDDIGFIFQTFHLISDLSVLDNVEIPLLYRRGRVGDAFFAA